jgi:hypothetical protein
MNTIFEDFEIMRPHLTPTRVKGEWEVRSQIPKREERERPTNWPWYDEPAAASWAPQPVESLEKHTFNQACHRARDVYRSRVRDFERHCELWRE